MKRRYKILFVAGCAAAALLCSTAAMAGPGSVTSAGVTKGKTDLKSTGVYSYENKGDAGESFKNEFEVEHGVTDNTQIKFKGEAKHTAGADTEFEKVAFTVKQKLTEKGEVFFDSAVQLTYSHGTRSGKANDLEAELVLAKDVGPYHLRSNFELANEFGKDADEEGIFEMKLGAYRKFGGVKLGLEYYGDFGELKDMQRYAKQEHYLGPRAMWAWALEDKTKIGLELGYYQGISRAAKDSTLLYRAKLSF